MAERHVTFALRAKYARLKGALEHYKGDDPGPLATAKYHVGAVLLMFNPSEDLDAVKAVRPCSHRRGRWSRWAMDILRHANGPLTAQELTRRIMAEAGLDQAGPRPSFSLHRVRATPNPRPYGGPRRGARDGPPEALGGRGLAAQSLGGSAKRCANRILS